jgi:FlaA1/EpsC-like NDP-sugar epimerase
MGVLLHGRWGRFAAYVGAYLIVAAVALFAAYLARFDGSVPSTFYRQLLKAMPWVVLAKVVSLVAVGQARSLPGYFSLIDLREVLIGSAGASLVILGASATFGESRIPRGVVIVDFLIFSGGVLTLRVALRRWGELRRRERHGGSTSAAALPVAIVGAGEAGASLIRELRSKPALRLKPVVLFDDNHLKWGNELHGVPIPGAPELLRQAPWRGQIRKVIIAMPSAPARRVGEIARLAAEIGVPSDTMPALDQVVAGHIKISQLRPVQITDLLRREQVTLDQVGLRQTVRDQVILVTGAGGSIGSELCRQLLALTPRLLLLVERCEVQLFVIEQELLERGGRNVIVPLVADIGDEARMREILGRFKPAAVFHAAAHKHVPMMESQPGEALRNNSLGTALLARLAAEYAVGRFVLISTDKAINPTNVMGASKRLAELYLQAFQAERPPGTRFMAVRFGNVLGSSGSVVPIFQKQIAAGGPVRVTHPEVTRYFMTIPEAVSLVLESAVLGEGGEIFVLDMGEPVKIIDLARQMIELSGYQPGEDIEIEFTGLRPGEKMFEEISHQREHLTPTGHPKIFRFVGPATTLGQMETYFARLQTRLNVAEATELKDLILEMVPEYRPYRGQ